MGPLFLRIRSAKSSVARAAFGVRQGGHVVGWWDLRSRVSFVVEEAMPRFLTKALADRYSIRQGFLCGCILFLGLALGGIMYFTTRSLLVASLAMVASPLLLLCCLEYIWHRYPSLRADALPADDRDFEGREDLQRAVDMLDLVDGDDQGQG